MDVDNIGDRIRGRREGLFAGRAGERHRPAARGVALGVLRQLAVGVVGIEPVNAGQRFAQRQFAFSLFGPRTPAAGVGGGRVSKRCVCRSLTVAARRLRSTGIGRGVRRIVRTGGEGGIKRIDVCISSRFCELHAQALSLYEVGVGSNTHQFRASAIVCCGPLTTFDNVAAPRERRTPASSESRTARSGAAISRITVSARYIARRRYPTPASVISHLGWDEFGSTLRRS